MLAVLQVVLLTSSLLLAPALVIAQDAGADASAQPTAAEPSLPAEEPAPPAEAEEPAPAQEPAPEPGAEEPKAESVPAQEPAPEPKAEEHKAEEPRAEKEQKPDKLDQEPAPEAKPELKADADPAGPAPDAAPADPEHKLVIDSAPRKLDLVVGETAKLSAWLCPAGGAPFGTDGEPATADDACAPALDAIWSIEPASAASLGKDEAAKVRLTADAPIDQAKVIAELGDRKDTAKLFITAAPVAEPLVVHEPEPQAYEHKAGPNQGDPKPDESMAGVPLDQESASDPGHRHDEQPTAESEPGLTDGAAASAPDLIGPSEVDRPGGLVPQVNDQIIQPAANNFNVTPASQTVTAGSVTSFNWTFTATNAGSVETTTFTIAAGWTAPSVVAGPGQVIVTAGTCTASLAGVTGQVVTIDQGPGTGTCGNGQTFTLQYRQATAPTPSSPPQTYTFTNQHGNDPTVTVTSPSANLAVTKTDGVTSVVAGDGVLRTFTITVSNAGPSTASGVTLTDTWPTGYARGTITPPSGVTCTDVSGGPSFSCALGSIASGGSAIVTVSYTVPSSTTGSQSNRAVVSSTSTDPSTANNTATDTNTVNRSADLSVTKTDGVSSVVAGATTPYTFSITVANLGPSDASGVVLTDTWPVGYTRGTITPPSGVTCTDVSGGPNFRCNLGTIAAGTNKVVTVTYTVPASTTGTRTNTGVATSSTPDPVLPNNTGSDTNTITQPADLSVTKTDGVTTVTAGAAAPQTFTMTVRNLGPGTASDVTLTDTWPAGYTQGAITSSQGTCTGGPSFSCALGSLASGGSATVTVAYTVPASTPAGNQSNIAAVSSTTADLVATNNTSTDTNTVATAADLSVTKSDGPDPVTAGANLTYTLVVTNSGPSDAQTVSLADTLPTGTTFVSLGQGSGPTFDCTTPAVGAAGAITCTRTSLAASAAAATFSLVVRVGAGVPAGTIISNTATVSGPTPDPNAANNSATATTTVATSADLSVTKSDGVDTVTAGDAVTRRFTITLSNAGPSDAGSVRLFDTWPAGYTLGAIAPSSGMCQSQALPPPLVISCTLGTITAGNSATVTIDYTVPASTPAGPQTNEALATSDVGDPNASNNTATDTNTVVTSADLSVIKNATPAETVAGGTVTYTLTVTNAGPSDAANATLSDTFPAQLQGVTVVDDGPYACAPPAGNTLTCTIPNHPVGVSATISITATVVAGAYADLTPVANTATVSSQTTDPDPANDTATATFKIRSIPTIAVVKTATPPTVPEPGGDVSFDVRVTNTGGVAVSLTSLVDSVHGDVNSKGTCTVPQSLAPGASYACSFSAFVGGVGGTVETSVVTARAATAEGRQASASGDATVTVSDIAPAIAVTKTASVTRLEEPGGDVTFTLTVQNLVPESLGIVALGDDLLGDLDDPRNPLLKDNSCANSVGDPIATGATFECRFTALVTGQAGDRHVNTVTVSVTDDEEALLAGGVRESAVTVISATAQAFIRIVPIRDGGTGDDDTGGGGGGSGDEQPSTDTLPPTHSASAATELVDGPMGWALIILAAAMLIVSGAWVIRRQRLTRM